MTLQLFIAQKEIIWNTVSRNNTANFSDEQRRRWVILKRCEPLQMVIDDQLVGCLIVLC